MASDAKSPSKHPGARIDPWPLAGNRRGFTLVELLVVVAILALISFLSVPAIISLKRSSDLQTGASAVIEQFKAAQQIATRLNETIEVRIYTSLGTQSLYDAVRLYYPSGLPASPLVAIPSSAGISTNNSFSTMRTLLTTTPPPTTHGTDATGPYFCFHFHPDGTTDLSSTSNTLTLLYRTNTQMPSLPANYVTIEINLTNGKVLTYRPE